MIACGTCSFGLNFDGHGFSKHVRNQFGRDTLTIDKFVQDEKSPQSFMRFASFMTWRRDMGLDIYVCLTLQQLKRLRIYLLSDEMR